MDVIDDIIKCQICKKILNSPVSLPCGESICRAHILDKTQIFCLECHKPHPIPSEGFVACRTVEKIIQRKIDMCEFGVEYKNALNGCKKLEEMLDEIDLIKRDPCFYICEIIGELRKEIDLKKEELKMKIDEEAEVLIIEMNEYESECKKNLKAFEFLVRANELDTNTKEVRMKLKEWLGDLRRFKINELKWRGVKEELEKIMKELMAKSNILKQNLLLNRAIKIDVEKPRSFIKSSIYALSGVLNSKIVDCCLINDLYKICEFPDDQQWSLLYRASEHGFRAVDFHTKCDNKPKTLTIIKSSNGNIFGGYTDECWDSTTSNYKSDPNAFLFSLVNLHSRPVKIGIGHNCADRAIYSSSSYGLVFGSNSEDLVISKFLKNNMRKGYSNLCMTYRLATYPQGANGSNFLAGSTEFDVIEVEVFMKN